MKVTLLKHQIYLLLILCTAFLQQCQNKNTFTDIDGNVYHSIQIGKQTWMVENLKTTRFNNGDSIVRQKNNVAWKNTNLPAYSSYNNQDANIKDYGLLYNWYCIGDRREIAPKGWHIPTEADLLELMQFIGADTTAGARLKEAGNTHWLPAPTTGTNATGFSALPGGYRDADGNFYMLKSNGYYWSNQSTFEFYHWSARVFQAFANVQRDPLFMKYGCAVKCIKDPEPLN